MTDVGCFACRPHPRIGQRTEAIQLRYRRRRVRAQAATFRLPFANRRSSHHKHVKDDHGRETSDYRPDAERPKDVFGAEALLVSQFVSAGESLLLRKCSVLIVHDAPASCFVRMTLALLF